MMQYWKKNIISEEKKRKISTKTVTVSYSLYWCWRCC